MEIHVAYQYASRFKFTNFGWIEVTSTFKAKNCYFNFIPCGLDHIDCNVTSILFIVFYWD